MADFVAVLRKTLDGMGETTPAIRQRVYEKARATVAAKLAAISPPPPPSVAERQRRALEDAIASIEKEYAANSDPLSELEDVFASLKNPQPKVLEQPTVKTGAWPKATPGPCRTKACRTGCTEARQAVPPPPQARQQAPAAPTAAPVDLGADEAPEEFYPAPAGRRAQAQLRAAARRGGHARGHRRRRLRHLAQPRCLRRLLGLGGSSEAVVTTPLVTEPAAETPAAEAPAAATSETPKFTQRLTPEGNETDPGPANGGATVGEGTSVANADPAARCDAADRGTARRNACAGWRGGDTRRDRTRRRRHPPPIRRLPSARRRSSTRSAPAPRKAPPSPARSSGRWSRNRPAAICRPSRRSAPRRPFRARTCSCA